jgi:hypothetical protein
VDEVDEGNGRGGEEFGRGFRGSTETPGNTEWRQSLPVHKPCGALCEQASQHDEQRPAGAVSAALRVHRLAKERCGGVLRIQHIKQACAVAHCVR